MASVGVGKRHDGPKELKVIKTRKKSQPIADDLRLFLNSLVIHFKFMRYCIQLEMLKLYSYY